MTSLNIKNKETYRLAHELADLTGESMTTAVTTAVRERLERVRCNEGKSLYDRITAIAEDSAPRFKPPYDTVDHGDLLYDELGLPK